MNHSRSPTVVPSLLVTNNSDECCGQSKLPLGRLVVPPPVMQKDRSTQVVPGEHLDLQTGEVQMCLREQLDNPILDTGLDMRPFKFSATCRVLENLRDRYLDSNNLGGTVTDIRRDEILQVIAAWTRNAWMQYNEVMGP